MDIGGGHGVGGIILPSTVASTRGLCGLVDPQVLLEFYHLWKKGQQNPVLVWAVRLCHQIIHDEGP